MTHLQNLLKSMILYCISIKIVLLLEDIDKFVEIQYYVNVIRFHVLFRTIIFVLRQGSKINRKDLNIWEILKNFIKIQKMQCLMIM